MNGPSCGNPPTIPMHPCVQDVLYYSFLAQYEIGTEGGGVSQGHTINEIVAEIQLAPTLQFMPQLTAIIDNLNQIDSRVRNAAVQVIGLPQDGTIIYKTSTPLQYAVKIFSEPTDNVPYRFGTDLDQIGLIGQSSNPPSLDSHLSYSVKYLGNGWRGSDGAAYTILDHLLTGCTN